MERIEIPLHWDAAFVVNRINKLNVSVWDRFFLRVSHRFAPKAQLTIQTYLNSAEEIASFGLAIVEICTNKYSTMDKSVSPFRAGGDCFELVFFPCWARPMMSNHGRHQRWKKVVALKWQWKSYTLWILKFKKKFKIKTRAWLWSVWYVPVLSHVLSQSNASM